jgi:hypothetical protein
MGADQHAATARRIFSWILNTGRRRFQKRDLHQENRSLFQTIKDVDPVLTLLEKHYLIRAETTQTKPARGRPSSPWYEANPEIFIAPQKSQKPHKSEDTGPDPICEVSEISEAHGEFRDEEVP